MSRLVENIDSYRRLLRHELPASTRNSLEWLLLTAVRERAGLQSGRDTPKLRGPQLLNVANAAVASAVSAQQAQFGGLHLYIATHDVLVMLASRNFGSGFTHHFAFLRPDGRTPCSRALSSGRRVVIEDVAHDEAFEPLVPIARDAGWRSVQATPLKSSSGEIFAILSTHFEAPRAFSEDELLAMDAHCRELSAQLARAWGTRH